MGAAVVDDPEDALGRRVRLAVHDLLRKPVERLDPGVGLDAIGPVGVMDVAPCQLREWAAALVLVAGRARPRSRADAQAPAAGSSHRRG